jgi:hypothetical protein
MIQDEVNAIPVVVPLTQKEKVIRGLIKSCKASYEAAVLANKWNTIISAQNPTAELEIFCITATDPSFATRDSAIVMLKKVKKHLIRNSLTVLEAFEKRCLMTSIQHVVYQEGHFEPVKSFEQPDNTTEGFEKRLDNAEKMIKELQDKQED